MEATQKVTKDWHRPVASDPDGGSFASYTDIRVIRGDEHWRSPTTSPSGGDTIAMALGLNRHLRGPELTDRLEELEVALAPFQMRPHWSVPPSCFCLKFIWASERPSQVDDLHTRGKMTTFGAEDYQRVYGSALDDFRRVADELDPSGKFRNAWAAGKIFGEEVQSVQAEVGVADVAAKT